MPGGPDDIVPKLLEVSLELDNFLHDLCVVRALVPERQEAEKDLEEKRAVLKPLRVLLRKIDLDESGGKAKIKRKRSINPVTAELMLNQAYRNVLSAFSRQPLPGTSIVWNILEQTEADQLESLLVKLIESYAAAHRRRIWAIEVEEAQTEVTFDGVQVEQSEDVDTGKVSIVFTGVTKQPIYDDWSVCDPEADNNLIAQKTLLFEWETKYSRDGLKILKTKFNRRLCGEEDFPAPAPPSSASQQREVFRTHMQRLKEAFRPTNADGCDLLPTERSSPTDSSSNASSATDSLRSRMHYTLSSLESQFLPTNVTPTNAPTLSTQLQSNAGVRARFLEDIISAVQAQGVSLADSWGSEG